MSLSGCSPFCMRILLMRQSVAAWTWGRFEGVGISSVLGHGPLGTSGAGVGAVVVWAGGAGEEAFAVRVWWWCCAARRLFLAALAQLAWWVRRCRVQVWLWRGAWWCVAMWARWASAVLVRAPVRRRAPAARIAVRSFWVVVWVCVRHGRGGSGALRLCLVMHSTHRPVWCRC